MRFSNTASYYHLLEDFLIGSALQRTRLAQLNIPSLDETKAHVLIVGEGNGRFLSVLLRQYPRLCITVIDESATMLDRAQARLEMAGLNCDNVTFRVADFLAVELPSAHFSLIVTHFFFSNFIEADVERMVRKLSDAASQNVQWVLGDFVLPGGGIYRLRAKIWLWILYRFFGWTAAVPVHVLPNVESHLTPSCI